MLDCKPADTPMVMNHGLQIVEGAKPVNQTQYQKLVGKLIYLSHTRPDLAYAVGVVSRFMHKPQKQHLEAVYRILRYLKGTTGKGVIYKNHGHLDLHAFTDADWGADRGSRKSTSGYFTLPHLVPPTPLPLLGPLSSDIRSLSNKACIEPGGFEAKLDVFTISGREWVALCWVVVC
uniref:Uncharacterized protein n=1 Tax=Chenopodium quinoa TaxID=63459 RepID=A0A803KTZ2_CHEQI